MKRLSKSLLLITLFCLIIFAVVLSGFRYFLPRLDNYRPEIETYLSKQFNSPVTMTQVKGEWQNFGPDIQITGIFLFVVGYCRYQREVLGMVLTP